MEGSLVIVRQDRAVSTSRSGCSSGLKRGARERASTIKWVLPGTQVMVKLKAGQLLTHSLQARVWQVEYSLLEDSIKRTMIGDNREVR